MLSKQRYIDEYIVSFMSTHDASHLCLPVPSTGPMISVPCKYEWALSAAEKAWEEYKQQSID